MDMNIGWLVGWLVGFEVLRIFYGKIEIFQQLL
jgi:hypothetical protein